jgi:hypothetical protein
MAEGRRGLPWKLTRMGQSTMGARRMQEPEMMAMASETAAREGGCRQASV